MEGVDLVGRASAGNGEGANGEMAWGEGDFDEVVATVMLPAAGISGKVGWRAKLDLKERTD